MKKEKKKKYDTVPEIYMDDSDSVTFFRRNYPVDSVQSSTNLIPGPTDCDDEWEQYGNTRIEDNL